MDIAQFQSPDFAGEVNFLAICQILNDKSPSTVGLFVKERTTELWAIVSTSQGFANQLVKAAVSDEETSPLVRPQFEEIKLQTIKTMAMECDEEIPY